MLKHTYKQPKTPQRVVILGAGGFISSAVQRKLESYTLPILPLFRQKLDLTMSESVDELVELLKPDDTLLFVAAKAPVKTEEMLINNLKMAEVVCAVLRRVNVNHVVYISSDAVYADNDQPLTEESSAQPGSLHGIMHLAREVMLVNAYQGRLCLLRPTLVYGKDDPHNGYGPNRFLRQAHKDEDIILFGKGEEQRDHVWVEDLAEIISKVIFHCSDGKLNVATGEVNSFQEIAEMAVQATGGNIKIKSVPRSGPMPHRGYRPFDINAVNSAFPEFRFSSLKNYFKINSDIN